MKKIKYPRVMVSNERLELLRKEAEAKDTSIMKIAEQKFKKAK